MLRLRSLNQVLTTLLTAALLLSHSGQAWATGEVFTRLFARFFSENRTLTSQILVRASPELDQFSRLILRSSDPTLAGISATAEAASEAENLSGEALLRRALRRLEDDGRIELAHELERRLQRIEQEAGVLRGAASSSDRRIALLRLLSREHLGIENSVLISRGESWGFRQPLSQVGAELSSPNERALRLALLDLEFATHPPRALSPGDQSLTHLRLASDLDVPVRYRADSERFRRLTMDPAHGSRRPDREARLEAMVGLEGEFQSLLRTGITRGSAEIDFFDGAGHPWDVKSPPSPRNGDHFQFDASRAGRSIERKLRGPDGSPRLFLNSITDQPEPARILLDSTFMSERDHRALWEWIRNHLSIEEQARIFELVLPLQLEPAPALPRAG